MKKHTWQNVATAFVTSVLIRFQRTIIDVPSIIMLWTVLTISILISWWMNALLNRSKDLRKRGSNWTTQWVAPMGIGGKHFKIYYRHKGGKFHNHSNIPCQHSAKKHVLPELLQSISLSREQFSRQPLWYPNRVFLTLWKNTNSSPGSRNNRIWAIPFSS